VIEMELVGVRVEMPSSSPIALLREVGGTGRVLPIFIGAPEATAIAFALEEVVTPRPMTHDLLQNVLDDLGVSLEKVTVTELRDGVFIAELELHAHDGVHTVSSRRPPTPSPWPLAPAPRSSPPRRSSPRPATSRTRRGATTPIRSQSRGVVEQFKRLHRLGESRGLRHLTLR
jgi:bifunctional DNase/RNase